MCVKKNNMRIILAFTARSALDGVSLGKVRSSTPCRSERPDCRLDDCGGHERKHEDHQWSRKSRTGHFSRIVMGLLAKSHQVGALRLHEDWDESGTESSQRCAASGERWFDLIGNMDSALAGRFVVLFGLDQRMEQLGSVGNGSVDQFASPFALNILTCTF